MVGMAPIAALMGIFIWLGLSAGELNGRTRSIMLMLTLAVLAVDFFACGTPSAPPPSP